MGARLINGVRVIVFMIGLVRERFSSGRLGVSNFIKIKLKSNRSYTVLLRLRISDSDFQIFRFSNSIIRMNYSMNCIFK